MLLSSLLTLFMFAGAVAAAFAVVLLWGTLFAAITEIVKLTTAQFIQSRRDDKLFIQIEEFRSDFS